MRFIAGAIVVLAGSLLWGIGACAISLAQAAKANVGDATMATYGGMAIVVAGLVILVMAHTAPLDRQ
jgi:hypothetical protein